MKLELTKDQLNNLSVFLQRTQMSGQEVTAYLELLQIINQLTNENAGITSAVEEKPSKPTK